MSKPDPYVLARFLDALWHEPGTPAVRRSKSSLQRSARVNYDLFKRYLAFVEKQGFVHVKPGKRSDEVTLTPAGREAHHRLVGWMQDLLGDW